MRMAELPRSREQEYHRSHVEPLWQKLLLALIGPVVGTLIIGGFLAFIARRAAEHRADAQLRE